MKHRYHKAAAQELEESADWYERQSTGLGREFINEVDHAIERILNGPETFELFDRELRRCPVRKYPFHILYRSNNSEIEIVCLMHTSRRPGYWRGRDTLNESE
ncbi:MAG: type II toxin-antitoxin system RelE/ParE family toxin [Planctomycetaceae bacterium]|nr:type II toxin-antitoxin system RelE/ParE family toxin [Planctomycetaceae bacterium]